MTRAARSTLKRAKSIYLLYFYIGLNIDIFRLFPFRARHFELVHQVWLQPNILGILPELHFLKEKKSDFKREFHLCYLSLLCLLMLLWRVIVFRQLESQQGQEVQSMFCCLSKSKHSMMQQSPNQRKYSDQSIKVFFGLDWFLSIIDKFRSEIRIEEKLNLACRFLHP